MKLYQNGDRCPCCGTVLRDKSRRWLEEFSQLVADLGLPDWPTPESQTTDLIFPIRIPHKEVIP